MFFFFFKQKTAYEMRISDWSSDVCSSDLRVKIASLRLQSLAPDMHGPRPNGAEAVPLTYLKAGSFAGFSLSTLHQGEKAFFRSEEHTSELQSLMRISYAVFCLKKKKNTQIHHNYHTNVIRISTDNNNMQKTT